jgi:hypothetical protein
VKRIAAAAVAVIAIGAGVYVLTRPSADIDQVGGFVTRSWGDLAERAGSRRFEGTGTVVAALSARNTRDHAVKLEVPEKQRTWLAEHGVRASVLFTPLGGGDAYGDYAGDADLEKGSATMAAHAEGELVHVFRVIDCRRPLDLPAGYALEVDGHEARTEISPTADERKLVSYESDMRKLWGDLILAGGC